ncbi:hypothetical protein [Psychrobacter sp. 1U2]|uniref:hypothetical protein n=1 Tax=Psychrobacter sp. 1U2 TaxID=3453577 RepID=UPI003F6E0BFC
MNKTLIKSYYMDFIQKEIRNQDLCMRKSVANFADLIISFIIDYEDMQDLKELDYSMIKRIVKSKETDNIQYTLHLLALEPYDVLNWVFYIESEDFYEPKREYIKKEELAEILNNKNFYNPLTDMKVSKEEFSRLVNTVFRVSDNFIKKVSDHSIGDNVL